MPFRLQSQTVASQPSILIIANWVDCSVRSQFAGDGRNAAQLEVKITPGVGLIIGLFNSLGLPSKIAGEAEVEKCFRPKLYKKINCGNAHVRCRSNRRSNRDAGHGLVTLSASQLKVLQD